MAPRPLGLPLWLFILIIVLVVLVVILMIIYLCRACTKGGEADPGEADNIEMSQRTACERACWADDTHT